MSDLSGELQIERDVAELQRRVAHLELIPAGKAIDIFPPRSSRRPRAVPAAVRGIGVDDEDKVISLSLAAEAGRFFLLLSVENAEFLSEALASEIAKHKARTR